MGCATGILRDRWIRAPTVTAAHGGYTGAMQVEVHLHAELARLAPDQRGVLTLDLPDGAHVADLLERLSLTAGTPRRVIVGLNGEAARLDQELVDGARIDLLTPMAGGELPE